MKCTICKLEIVLVPSASERAARHGGKPSDYTRLFTEHAACTVSKRSAASVELMRRLVTEAAQRQVILYPSRYSDRRSHWLNEYTDGRYL